MIAARQHPHADPKRERTAEMRLRRDRWNCITEMGHVVTGSQYKTVPLLVTVQSQGHRASGLKEFSSSTRGPKTAPDPTLALGRSNPFPVTGAAE